MYEVAVLTGEKIDFTFFISAKDDSDARKTVARLNRIDANVAFVLVDNED